MAIPVNSNVKNTKSTRPGDRGARDENFSLNFGIPNWGIKDFIRERTSWTKGIDTLTGEPGWFYFKLFFKFDTRYGLLGGILDSKDSNNTATGFLEQANNMYKADQLVHRRLALHKFVGLLSFINERAPWFFNSITGLQNANTINLSGELSKGHELEIGCLEDAVDMRLSTLFELYKYACFDNINLKEIIPENLRKFDLTVMVFHTPLRYYQTGTQSAHVGTYNYKSFNDVDFSQRMSWRMFTFTNCEFDLESLGTFMPASMNNETAFNLAKNSFKIKYNRVYTHTFNEWNQIQFGDDGFVYNKGSKLIENSESGEGEYSTQSSRISALQAALDNYNMGYWNPSADLYKNLIDGVEKEVNDILRTVKPEVALGNLYGNYSTRGKGFLDQIKTIGAQFKSLAVGGGGYGVDSNYFKDRVYMEKHGDPELHKGPFNSDKYKKK